MGEAMVDVNWLCSWLEENSSGVYRPAKEAAHVIRSMQSEINDLRAVLAKAGEQRPVGVTDAEGNLKTYCDRLPANTQIYANPLPAQPIGYADQSEIESIGKRGQSCLILPEPEFDISVPVFVGSAPAQAIPEGWKLVPLEPTKEMCDAYCEHAIASTSHLSVRGYKAMLSASPKP